MYPHIHKNNVIHSARTHTYTHTAGDDYSTEVVSFTVPPGVGPTIVQLDILDDVIKENTEQYFAGVLEFSGDSTGAALGISNIQLVIIDDESE